MVYNHFLFSHFEEGKIDIILVTFFPLLIDMI